MAQNFHKQLRRNRRFTNHPPDALSQTTMAVPMYLLYEGGIILARILHKPKPEDEAADAGAEA